MTQGSIQQERRAGAREDVERLFARRLKFWNQHDAAGLAADYTADCVVESPMGGTLNGREAVEGLFRDLFRAFPDLEYRYDKILVDGDHVALFISMHGSHVGEFFGHSGTGRSFEIRGALLSTLRGEQIAEEHRIYDFTGFLLQIAVLKAKPAF